MVRTEVEDEIRALLVRHARIRIVRVLALLVRDDQPLVARRAGVPLQVVAERLGADDVRETAEGGRAVQDLEEEALHVDGPAFVEPEVRRVCVAEERNYKRRSEDTGKGPYVTPLPNQE